jgi:ABC-type antimicrobial peptide transport system permease subunit
MPLSPGRTGVVFRLASADEWHEIDLNVVSRDYFSLVGIPIVDGRTFLPTDSDDVAHAAIITEATARRYWGARNPVGETMVVAFGEDQQFPLEIVGVARDAQLSQVGRIDSSYVYLPPVPRSQRTLKLLVRSQGGFSAIAPFIRTAIAQLDPGLAAQIAPLERNLDFWRTIARLVGSLSASLGLLALALASIGVYGVVSFVVSRRLREMAIRITLGATGREIRTMILRQTMRPVAAGMIVGAGAAAAASRVLESVLFGISPLDPAAFMGAALVLAIVAMIASLVPTRRALRIDPQLTLRDE